MTRISRISKRATASMVIGMIAMWGLAEQTLAQAPPSGEAPRLPPSAQGEKGQPKKPVLTIANRDAMLRDLYDQLAKIKDAEAAKPVYAAIAQVWNFTGSPTADVLVDRARQATEAGDFASAVNFLDAVTELQPNFAQGWFLRAMAFKLSNDSHRMLGDLRRALSVDPKHFDALKALALELNERGQKKAALEAYSKLLEAYPSAPKSDDPILKELARQLDGQGI